jgi:Xaa-Pro aminopeptidase
MAIFSEAEIQRRQSEIRTGLREVGVDAALLTSADNCYYATGIPLLSEWGRPMWALLLADGGSTVIGAELEKENMRRDAHVTDIATYDDSSQAVVNALNLAVARIPAGAVRIGVELDSLSVRVFRELEQRFPKAEFVDVGAVVARARIRKSAEEAALLGVAADVAKIGANAFLEALTPGNTELAVAGHARSAMDKALGALFPSGATSTYVYAQFGDHSLTPHLHPTGRRLRRGDIVALNVFPVVWGYCIELERTLVFGPRTERQEQLLDILDEAFELGKARCRPGKQFKELHEECCQVIEKAGLGAYIRHGTGHAHGIMVGSASREDLGEIREYNQGTIQPGMFNSIEPGFYLAEEGGFRHSDVMRVEADGATCITEFPVRLDL